MRHVREPVRPAPECPGSSPMAQCLHQGDESGRGLAAARIVEIVGVPIGAILLKHADQPPLGNVWPDDLFHHVGQPETVECGFQEIEAVVEGQLPLNTDLDLAPVVLELPLVKPAGCRKAEVDACVADEVLGVERFRTVGEVGSARRRRPCGHPG